MVFRYCSAESSRTRLTDPDLVDSWEASEARGVGLDPSASQPLSTSASDIANTEANIPRTRFRGALASYRRLNKEPASQQKNTMLRQLPARLQPARRKL